MTLSQIIANFTGIALKLIPFFASLAFLAFVWGVARFIRASGEKDSKDAKKLLIWGVIGLLVLTTIWGIIAFTQKELNLGDGSGLFIPQIPTDI